MNPVFISERDAILASVRKQRLDLKQVPSNYHGDYEIALETINNSIFSIYAVDKELKKNRIFMQAVAEKDGRAFHEADEVLKQDRDYVWKLIHIDGRAIHGAHQTFKEDFSFALAAVKQNGNALQFVSSKFMGNEKIVFSALASSSKALYSVQPDLRENIIRSMQIFFDIVVLSDGFHAIKTKEGQTMPKSFGQMIVDLFDYTNQEDIPRQQDNARRFFTIAKQLPLDMQRVLANRASGIKADALPTSLFDEISLLWCKGKGAYDIQQFTYQCKIKNLSQRWGVVMER